MFKSEACCDIRAAQPRDKKCAIHKGSNMENQHLLIVGCRDLDKGNIDLINEVKKTANLVATTIEKMECSASADSNWVSIARSQLQLGFMALDRAIAKPTS